MYLLNARNNATMVTALIVAFRNLMPSFSKFPTAGAAVTTYSSVNNVAAPLRHSSLLWVWQRRV
jgi:hypothetical protein